MYSLLNWEELKIKTNIEFEEKQLIKNEVGVSPSLGRQMLIKVPQITVFFWIIKILTTGMGEVASDFLAHQLNPVIALALEAIGLALALLLQLHVRKYIAWIYWLAVIMVSTFGTMAADVLHVGFGIPYIVSTIFFSAVLAIVFLIWYKVEKTLSIHSINTSRREAFYWISVLTSFALGTAAGDLTATNLNLGYFYSGMLFACLFAAPALYYWRFKKNEIFTFWFAYIITRPFGASFADWAGVSRSHGGLGLGTGTVSLILTIIILCFVGYLAYTRRDIKEIPS